MQSVFSPSIREGEIGGGKGIRTPGLFIANEALYQLSYTPDFAGVMLTAQRRFSRTLRTSEKLLFVILLLIILFS